MTKTPKSFGQVQVLVDGVPQGAPVGMCDGDSVLYTMPGKLLNGAVAIAEDRIAALQAELTARADTIAGREQTIREMASAGSLDEAAGIAWRSGALQDDDCW